MFDRGVKRTVTRRQWLSGATATLAAAAVRGNAAAAATQAPDRLPLTAAATEGPYYLDAMPVRSDITEGLAGVPLELRLRAVDVQGVALKGARVDVWHCDAQGNYSGFDDRGDSRGSTRRYLRGTQTTDAAGLVSFTTVYPGWYRGRTTHIHFKLLVEDRALLTSQLLLPDALSEFLYANLPAYRRSAIRDTLNSTDGIGIAAGSSIAGAVREEADRYVSSLDMVVSRDALAPPAAGRGGRNRSTSESGRVGALIPGV